MFGHLCFSVATDGNNTWQTQNLLYNYARTGVTVHSVNYVQSSATTVANANCNCDGVQPVQGDVILLTAQSNAAQNGPYVVGPLTANVAALSRPSDFASGSLIKVPQTFEVAAGGTSYGSTTWKITGTANANPLTVDTTSLTITNSLYNYARGSVLSHEVNYVQTANSNVAACNCNADGLQPTAGEYPPREPGERGAEWAGIAGTLTANVAALTRPSDFATGQVLRVPQTFEVAGGGTSWGNSSWKTTVPTGASNSTSGSITVDTTALTLYPRVLNGSIANVATANAAANVTGLWILSNTTSVLVTSNNTANSNNYCYVSANVGNAANAGYFTVISSATTAVSGKWSIDNW